MAQKFTLDDDVLTVEVKGKSYDVRFPSYSEVSEYQKRVEASKDGGAPEILFDFLQNLGLPVDVSKGLSARNIKKLIEALLNDEKKS